MNELDRITLVLKYGRPEFSEQWISSLPQRLARCVSDTIRHFGATHLRIYFPHTAIYTIGYTLQVIDGELKGQLRDELFGVIMQEIYFYDQSR